MYWPNPGLISDGKKMKNIKSQWGSKSNLDENRLITRADTKVDLSDNHEEHPNGLTNLIQLEATEWRTCEISKIQGGRTKGGTECKKDQNYPIQFEH